MLLAFAIPTTVHAIVGNFIEPRVLGGAMELHPIVVLLSLMLWGCVWPLITNPKPFKPQPQILNPKPSCGGGALS